MNTLILILRETCIDSLKLLPFLFITYFLLEFLELKASDRSARLISESHRFGPVIGALLGVIPQCGFSAISSEFYSKRVITLGTLLAIYLSTSDEMLPILLSERTSAHIILNILVIKVIVGIIFGFLIDMYINKKRKVSSNAASADLHFTHEPAAVSDNGKLFLTILKDSLRHTSQTLFFIFLVTLAIEALVCLSGADSLSGIILNQPVAGELLAALIGLIPNCSGSVIITQLYLNGAMQTGAIMSGLLASAGIGPLMLWRTNHNRRENIIIILLLYSISVICGLLIDLIGFAL